MTMSSLNIKRRKEMNRKIKFRAIDALTGKMVYGDIPMVRKSPGQG